MPLHIFFLLCWCTASISAQNDKYGGNSDNWGDNDNNWGTNNNWNNNNWGSSTTPGPNVALIFMQYERAEIELMDLVEKEEEARVRSVTINDAADELNRFIKLLYTTDQMGEFENRWVSAIDEAKSVLYITLRKAAIYFQGALSCAMDVEKMLTAEKDRAENELARGMRKIILANVEEEETLTPEAQQKLVEEDKKKIAEAVERAKTAKEEAKVKLASIRKACTETLLHFQCRWLGSYKKRLEAADHFESETRLLLQTTEGVSRLKKKLGKDSKTIEEVATDSNQIQKEVDAYKGAISIFERRLAEVKPRTKLLADIEETIQSLLRKDNLLNYTRSKSVALLNTLLKQARDYFARYVNREGVDSSAPPQMIANIQDTTISLVADKFDRVMGALDFGNILDYD
uniref:Uncharacterized protein n=1 Tax=Plectus sambesii TaxID=2011161 RepID=A0A914WA76_9BILA